VFEQKMLTAAQARAIFTNHLSEGKLGYVYLEIEELAKKGFCRLSTQCLGEFDKKEIQTLRDLGYVVEFHHYDYRVEISW
jgi:hypothetical protein